MQATYAGPVKLVLFDVDGVLTDGGLYLGPSGELLKKFNVRDGLAVSLLRCHGIRSGVLSGKSSEALDFRIQQLKFDVSVTGRLDKQSAYQKIKQDLGVEDAEVAYVGDDVVDLPLVGRVGLFFAPSDAHAMVLAKADHVMCARGGGGVAREVAEHVLLSGGLSLEQAYQPLMEGWSELHVVQ